MSASEVSGARLLRRSMPGTRTLAPVSAAVEVPRNHMCTSPMEEDPEASTFEAMPELPAEGRGMVDAKRCAPLSKYTGLYNCVVIENKYSGTEFWARWERCLESR